MLPDEQEPAGWVERIIPGRFAGRTVVVTGAAGGIGLATASRVAREGGRLIAADISADRLHDLAAAQPDSPIVPVTAYVTDQAGIDAIVAAAGDGIDALANVAVSTRTSPRCTKPPTPCGTGS